MLKQMIQIGILLALCYSSVFCSIASVSSIKACINDGSGEILKQKNGTSCRKQLVVAMTVEANEGKSQYLEARVRRVHDSTTNKNVELKTPVRIKVTKSPVLINYRLYQIGYVNSNPTEEIRKKKGKRCRHDWFSKRNEAACGFKYDKSGEKIFDSQGFCCKCSFRKGAFDRGESAGCLRQKVTAHCLKMDPLYMFVFGLYPPQLQFEIKIKVEKVSYTKKSGEPVYETIEELVLGPSQRISTSNDFRVRGEYVADFHPSTFMPVLAHKYLMIPDLRKLKTFSSKWVSAADSFGYYKAIQNVSEWLLVDKHQYDFNGLHCDKIGVSYSAFRNQPDRCTAHRESCLTGQPRMLWALDNHRRYQKRRVLYLLYSFGRVHSAPHSKKRTDFQLNFIADRVQKSLITLSMEADDLKSVINRSPGRIVEAYIDPFESLSIDGHLNVYVQNTGSITATYTIFVGHCSGGIDWVPSKSVTIDPGKETNVTFTIHSFHSIGQINKCKVELLDQMSEVLDNMTISFETLDTCFCYGYCGCTCGDNVTECPPKPNYQNPDAFSSLNIHFEEPEIKWMKDVTSWMKGHFGGILLSSWIILALIGLGVLKVVMMLYSGEVKCPAVDKPAKAVFKIFCEIFKLCGGTMCSCLTSTTLNLAWGTTVIAKGKDATKYIGREDLSSNAKRPINCDGMCRGAKQARRIHRKRLRLMKRRGAKMGKVGPWWEKKYNCTCVVRDTKNLLEILKGLFFFIYCPLLPLWWLVEFSFEWIQRKRRRERRRKEFIAKKKERQAKEENTYLMLDKYTRGTKEKKVIDFDAEKNKVKKKKQKEIEAMEEGQMMRFSSDEELGLDSTDTTATDEALDMDELLDPGYPVYMNYAKISDSNRPKSLKDPGKSFSIKGRLTGKGQDYIFDLYKYTKQINSQVKGKMVKLKTPNELDPLDFKQTLQPNVVQLLITLSPLFVCLNK